ncbi:nitrogen fixation protein NifQ [Aquabacter spiritensis]|uniref:Nitrogen fixation protein NifQ n=1 Tax=Aquabacter spiritensis TaxID=933073 RepID=A0A4R3M8B5_9HYPH|nr:nitrogen fixation protein NifQ [Aquabacter spiritensis]TCT07887.1 nitrogen fixation protein NifQ [Aquabacter spiritensis]
MTAPVPRQHATELAPAPAYAEMRASEAGIALYVRLTGCRPTHAPTESDTGFDRHILASILAMSAAEGGRLTDRCGLSEPALADLGARFFPDADLITCVAMPAPQPAPALPDPDEVAMVRDLLLSHRSSDLGPWLAVLLARRAMEPNHLWEDLGLRERSELTRLLTRHFAPLAVRNTRNMRWKRFFYRMLCESDGFVMCATPVCTQCTDFSVCFAEKTSESRMADRRRALALAAPASAEAALQPAAQPR